MMYFQRYNIIEKKEHCIPTQQDLLLRNISYPILLPSHWLHYLKVGKQGVDIGLNKLKTLKDLMNFPKS